MIDVRRLSEHLIQMVAVVGITLFVIVYGIAEINLSIKYMNAHPSLKDLTWWEAMLMGGDLAVHGLYYNFGSFLGSFS